MGKSTLAAALADLAGDRFVFLWGHADIFANAAAPFATWRPIFAEIFTYEGAPDALLADVHGALERQGLPPERAGFASVVLPLLPARVPDGLRPDDVARLTCETLTALLRDGVAERREYVLVLDDAHWMDTGSWMLVAQAVQDVAGVLPGHPRPARTRRGVAGHGEVGAHNRRPPATGAAVANSDRRGNPRGIGRRATRGMVGGACRAVWRKSAVRTATGAGAAGPEGASNGERFPLRMEVDRTILRLALPTSIQRAIVGSKSIACRQISRSLKASSVIGTTFLLRAVVALLAFDDGASHVATLRERLDQLVEFGMLAVERTDPDPSYRFDHALTQEAIYHLLSFENRRRLHAATATFLEFQSEARQPRPATLGLHWSRAGRPERAQPNWEAAAIAALSAGAYREAAAAFREALAELHALPERLRAPSDPAATWAACAICSAKPCCRREKSRRARCI